MTLEKQIANARARAKSLATTANKDYAKYKRAAEKAVKTWQWATSETTDPDPTRFATNKKIRPGRKLPKKPAKANYQAQEGFDAQGRVVVKRTFFQWEHFYETFITYAPGEIISIRYGTAEPKQWEHVRVFVTDASGRVVASEAQSSGDGSISRTFTLDERGFYTAERGTNGIYGTLSFEFDCDAKGKIVRTWSIDAKGSRTLRMGKAP